MSKEKYRDFAKANKLPLFLHPWWLEAAMADDGDWDAVIEGKTVLPYCYKKRLGITNLFIPWCTPYLSAYGEINEATLAKLISRLPSAADYRFRLFPGETHVLWTKQGFSITPTKTFIIPSTTTDVEKIFTSSARRQVSKKIVTAELSDDWETAYRLWESTMNRKRSIHALAPKNVVASIETALRSHGQREIWLAKDAEGQVHAAIYVAFDKNCSYYLWGGYDPAYASSGATSLLFYKAIHSALNAGRSFDFEGSMVESIAKFYAGFGAQEYPVFSLHKSNMIGKILKKGK